MRKLLLILTILFLANQSFGQSYSFQKTNEGSLTVLPVVFLSLTQVGGVPSFDDENDYNNGITVNTYANAWVKANLPWIVTVKAQNATFTPMTTGASSTMPCSVITLKKSTNSTWLTLSTTAQTLTTGPLGPNTVSGNTWDVSMRFNPGWTYPGGLYRLNVIFTASQQ
jgi:hypothetical protein